MRRIAITVGIVVGLLVGPALVDPVAATPGPVPTSFESLGVARSFRCGVTATGGVRCWGSDDNGGLGRGTQQPDALVPAPVVGLPAGAVAIAAGTTHACALVGEAAGAVWCWGDSSASQTGTTRDYTDPLRTPTKVSGLPDVVDLAAGGSHTCAVTELGATWCWGDDLHRQLGPGGDGSDRATPIVVTGVPKAVEVAAGQYHTCILGVDGTVWCLGYNNRGQLGRAAIAASDEAPAQVQGIGAAARELAAGGDETCVVTVAGAARCWGANYASQLGDGTTTDRGAPVTPTGLGSKVRTIAVGGEHACAISTAGALSCWGRNAKGEVGLGDRASATAPTTVPGLGSGVRSVAGGSFGTCAVLVAGSARCWGAASNGELGDGTDATVGTPATTGATNAVGVSAGGYASCAVRSGGGIRCWGSNAQGLFGDGTTAPSIAPVATSGITDALAVDVGLFHACAVEQDGQVRCWGRNIAGELGLGPSGGVLVPTLVTGVGGDAVTIAVSDEHSCAGRPTGVRCWGENRFGQLGDGTTDDRDVPTSVSGLGGSVLEVSAGSTHTCARLANGSARCWGQNAGRLGNGQTTDSSVPVTPTGLTAGVTSISAGADHTCAVVSGGVRCWGLNTFDQVGPDPSALVTTPYSIPGLTSGWVEVVAGRQLSCARSTTGRVACWGSNVRHQLGDGSAVESTDTPVQVLASGAVDLDAMSAANTVCAAMADGSARCWGANLEGSVGVDPGWTPRTVSGGSVWSGGAPWAPFASWTALVDQQFTDLLARTPTTAERSTAVTALTNGTGTPGDLLAALRADVDQTGAVDPTTRLYFAYFLRIPDKSGLEFWIRRKRSGYLLRTISDSFATSSEFTRRYGSLTNRQFVELIYQNLFSRAGDAAGVDYWTRRLDARAESRGGVMAQFSESSEYKRKMANEVTISVLHLLIQQRQVSQAEFDAELARLDQGAMTVAGFAGELLGSSTYLGRFD